MFCYPSTHYNPKPKQKPQLKRLNATFSDMLLESLKARLPDYEHPGVLVALEISIEALPELEREAFLDLAVFPEDVAIPEATIKTMWSKRFTTIDAAEDALQLLVTRCVLMRDPLRNYRLHDLYYDYLQAFAENLPSLHRQLVKGYKTECNGIWHQGPDDGYFYKHLPHHLYSGYRDKKLWRNLLSNYDWIKAKLDYTDINSLIEDYARVSEHQKDLLLIQQTLRLSGLAFSKGSRHLSSQLLGRIKPSKRPVLTKLRRKSFADSESQGLRPLDTTLTPPGGTLLQTFSGHAGNIYALNVTTDGTHAITGASDRTARVWDLEAGTLRHTIRGHSRSVEAVAISPDQRWIATVSSGTIFLWDFDTAQLVIHISYGNYFTEKLFFSNDSQKLFAWDAYDDEIGSVKLSSGEQQMTSAAKNVITCAGELCVIKRGKGRIALLNLDTMDTTPLAQSDSKAEQQLQFTPDRTRIVGMIKVSNKKLKAKDDQVEWRVWDAEAGELLHLYRDVPRNFDISYIDNVSLVTTDADLVLWSADSYDGIKSIWALNINSGDIEFEIKNSKGIASYAASRDAQRIVYSIPGRKHFLVSRDNPKKSKLICEHGRSYHREPLITLQGNRLLTVSGRSLVLSDLERGAYKQRKVTHPEGVICSDVVLGTNTLLTAGRSGSLAFWTSDGNASGKAIDLNFVLRRVSASADHLVVGGGSGKLFILDGKTRKALHSLRGHINVIKAIGVLDSRRKCVTFAGRGAPMLWDLSTGRLLRQFDEPTTDPSIVAIAPTGDVAVSVGTKIAKSGGLWERSRTRILDVWDLMSGKRIRKFKLISEGGAVNDLAFTTCNTSVIAACGDHKLRIANIKKGKVTHMLEGHKGSVNLVRITGDTVISASNDRTVRIWHLRSLDQLRVVECDSPVKCLQIMPGGWSFVFGTESGDVEVRDVRTGSLLADFRADTRITTICVSESNIIFVGTADGIVHRLQSRYLL